MFENPVVIKTKTFFGIIVDKIKEIHRKNQQINELSRLTERDFRDMGVNREDIRYSVRHYKI